MSMDSGFPTASSVVGRFPLQLLVAAATLLALPALARAEVDIWQALFFRPAVFRNAWWVLPLGLAIQYPAFRWMSRLRPLPAAALTFGVNLVAFFAGFLLQWPTSFIQEGPQQLTAVCVIAVLGSALIEWGLVGFICRGCWTRHTFSVLLLVNIPSVMLQMLTVWYFA